MPSDTKSQNKGSEKESFCKQILKKFIAFWKYELGRYAALSLAAIGLYLFIRILAKHTVWEAASGLLLYTICLTAYVIARDFLVRKKLHDLGPWFEQSKELEDHRERLVSHYKRIKGTLIYWKSSAAAHKTLHNAQVIWGAITGVLLSVLIPLSRGEDEVLFFLTLLAAWNVVLLTLSFVFNAREKYYGFRQVESDFYDASRELLMFTPMDPFHVHPNRST